MADGEWRHPPPPVRRTLLAAGRGGALFHGGATAPDVGQENGRPIGKFPRAADDPSRRFVAALGVGFDMAGSGHFLWCGGPGGWCRMTFCGDDRDKRGGGNQRGGESQFESVHGRVPVTGSFWFRRRLSPSFTPAYPTAAETPQIFSGSSIVCSTSRSPPAPQQRFATTRAWQH